MNFNSPTFVIFLVVVFALHWAPIMRGGRHRNAVLLVASYFFYGWWDWRFLGLILASSLLDYTLGRWLGATSEKRARDGILLLSIVANLGTLFFFKYFNFFLDSLKVLLGADDIPWSMRIILPVGISFYTFQTMSYCIDIHRRQMQPTRDLLGFLTFVSFFPQLVAGPIERAKELLPQLMGQRRFDRQQAVEGLRLMLVGAFKKMVIADRFAPLADAVFDHPTLFLGAFNILGAACFALQIYGDFSGYSDIARGTAKLFGVELMVNFNRPYQALSLRDFWARWHISLSTWFRDYVYIPLGGNRAGVLMHGRNLMITFLLSGLWHGANWTFVAWGGLHGAFLLVERVARGGLDRLPGSVRWAITMLVVLIGWVFFRAQDLGHATLYLRRALRFDLDPLFLLKRLLTYAELSPTGLAITLTAGLALIGLDRWSARPHALAVLHTRPVLRHAGYAALVLAILFFGVFTDQRAFIYFQF
ncbi:MAG: MBOAT family protein [Flavobacteriales bacterium]|nr:MBOAT family protein [Flavobacteriales bacterium]